MDYIDKLISIINDKITTITNNITNNEDIKLLRSMSSKLKNDIWNINNSDISNIRSLLKYNPLSKEEIYFIRNIPRLSKNEKEAIIKIIGDINKGNIYQVKSITNKIELEINKITKINKTNYDKKLSQYKSLLTKLENKDKIITEVDLIANLLDEIDLELDTQINILNHINIFNSNIYNNIDMNNTLKETNLDSELLDKLFQEFNINWDDVYRNIKNEKNREYLLLCVSNYKKLLLKYGNYDNMKNILTLLKDKELDFIFKLPEILTKTLLYSSVVDINNLLDTAFENKFDYLDLVRREPTILYPASKGNKEFGNNYTTGTLKHFIDNVKFLNKHNINPQEVYSSSPSFFTTSATSHELFYKRLKLYGIDIKYPNGNLKKIFGAFNISDILTKIDMCIENGLYDYIEDNLTKLASKSFNPYRVKLAIKEVLKEDDIFTKKYLSSKGGTKKCLKRDFWKDKCDTYGIKPEDTYKLYNSINISDYISSDDIFSYNEILDNNISDSITDITLNNPLIKELDSMYSDNNKNKVYNFNGVIISRLKVLRYCETLITTNNIPLNKDLLLYLITYNTMLDIDELNNIYVCLDNLKYKGRNI